MNITAQQIQEIVADTVREELARAGVTPKPKQVMLTVVQAAEMLAVSQEMIYKMINNGVLEAIDLSSKSTSAQIKSGSQKGNRQAPEIAPKRHKRSFRISVLEIERLTAIRGSKQK